MLARRLATSVGSPGHGVIISEADVRIISAEVFSLPFSQGWTPLRYAGLNQGRGRCKFGVRRRKQLMVALQRQCLGKSTMKKSLPPVLNLRA